MELSELEGLRFHRVQSSRAVPSTNLTGTWKFQTSTGSNTFIKSLSESALVLKGKLPTALNVPDPGDANPDYTINNEGFQQNPVGGIFSSVNMSINGQELPAITDWKCYTAIKKALDSSIEQERNGNDPMLLAAGYFAVVGANGSGTLTIVPYANTKTISESNVMTHIINSQIIHGHFALESATDIAANTPFTLIFQFPFMDMLKEQDEFIGPNTHISLTLQVSPTVTNDLFIGTELARTVDWNSFEWVIPVYTSNPLTDMKLMRRFTEVETQRFSMGSTKYFQVIAPSNLHRVAMCIMRQSALDFQSNVPLMPTSELTSLYIQYGGKTFPESAYRLSRTATENDWANAWKDYQTFTEAYRSGELPVIKDFQTYLYHPVFVFQCRQPSGSVVSTPLNIYFDTGAVALNNYDLCIYMESVSELSMSYDENGAIVETVYEKIG